VAASKEARSLDTPPERLAQLAGRSPALARLVAKNPAAPPELLSDLARRAQKHGDTALEREIVQNPSTPIACAAELGARYPREFLKNPALPLLLLEEPSFFPKLPAATLKQLARLPEAPPVLFTSCAAHPDPEVRRVIAEGRATPEEVLLRLSEDQAALVLWGLVNRTSLSAELSYRLAGINNYGLRGALARHPACTPEALWRLHREGDEALKPLLARHPGAPPALLAELAAIRAAEVRRLVALHPATPLVALKALAKDPNEGARVAAQRSLAKRRREEEL
jgi:hypothetical protein